MGSALTCPNCDAGLASEDRYCGNCGREISGAALEVGAAGGEEDPLLEALRRATIGEYDVQGELGRGGMAVVYLAHEIALDRKVAVKVLSRHLQLAPGMAKRFRREAQTAARLEHRHIIPIYSVRETDELVFFTMRWVPSRPLSAIAKQAGRLPIPVVLAVLAEVGSALSFAHAHGVLHRDVKAANVLVGRDGSVIVTDFGIAKQTDNPGVSATGLTGPGQFLGTPGYVSPEQIRGQELTAASDQYSLGVLLFELLAGRTPHVGANSNEIVFKQITEAPPDVVGLRPDCPQRLADVIGRMLEKDPERRFPSLDAAIAAAGAVPLPPGDPLRKELVALAEDPATPTGASVTPVSPAHGSSARGSKPAARPVTPASAPRNVVSKPAAVADAPKRTDRPDDASRPAKARSQVSRRPMAAVVGLVGMAAAALVGWFVMSGGDAGRVRVSDLPAGSSVFVDGSLTPGPEFEVLPGAREIRVEAPGFLPTVDTVVAEADQVSTLRYHGAPVPPPATTGTLIVVGLPAAGVVRVDGVRSSRPEVSLATGRHSVRLDAPGFASVAVDVVIAAGETDTVRFTGAPVITKPPGGDGPKINEVAGSGVLMLRVTPYARIFVDGRLAVEDEVLVKSLPAGRHRLRFERAGFVTSDTSLAIGVGDTLKVRVTMRRSPE